MKNTFALLIISLMAVGCDLADKSGSELSDDNQITIGHIESVKSDILGETRNIWVHLPQNYQEGKKYPVLYVLDGPGHFHSVTGLIKQLSTNGTFVLPEMIVIAIPNTNRSRDLIPTKVDVVAHGMWNWGQYNRERTIPEEISNTLDKMINNEVGYMPTQRVIAGLGEVMLPTIVNYPEFSSITPKSLIDWYKTTEAQWFKEELRIGFDGMPDQSISDAFLFGRIGKGNKVIQYLRSSNHPILLASDFPGSPSFANQPGLTTYQEMKAMVTAGLSLEDVMAAATINNAKQFRIDNEYGTVEVGKIANLLLLKANPLDSIEAWNSIETIILHGDPIARESLVVNK